MSLVQIGCFTGLMVTIPTPNEAVHLEGLFHMECLSSPRLGPEWILILDDNTNQVSQLSVKSGKIIVSDAHFNFRRVKWIIEESWPKIPDKVRTKSILNLNTQVLTKRSIKGSTATVYWTGECAFIEAPTSQSP